MINSDHLDPAHLALFAGLVATAALVLFLAGVTVAAVALLTTSLIVASVWVCFGDRIEALIDSIT